MHHAEKGPFARALARGLVLGLGLAVAAAPMRAQVRGLPVYNAGVPRGIVVSADIGFPNEDAGEGLGYAVTGSAGIGLLGATATVGAYNPGGPAESDVVLGATANFRVFGGPLVPLSVTLQGGISHHKQEVVGGDVTDLRMPVGVGFALTIPNPALAIRPWIAPRVDIVRRNVESVSLSETNTDAEFAISGGLELNFLNGFGLHAAYDLMPDGPGSPGVFGVGAHYALRIPGL